jgi:hypothetical protein
MKRSPIGGRFFNEMFIPVVCRYGTERERLLEFLPARCAANLNQM